MNESKQSVGKEGERLALTFLKQQGYKIIEQNFRTRLGEIDIVGYREKALCFIEVKTRTNTEFGLPEESITRAKQRQIIQTARYFLKRRKIPETVPCRFDVVSIILKDPTPDISLIKNAFTAGSIYR